MAVRAGKGKSEPSALLSRAQVELQSLACTKGHPVGQPEGMATTLISYTFCMTWCQTISSMEKQ